MGLKAPPARLNASARSATQSTPSACKACCRMMSMALSKKAPASGVIAVGLTCGLGAGFLPARTIAGLRKSNEHARMRIWYFMAEQGYHSESTYLIAQRLQNATYSGPVRA